MAKSKEGSKTSFGGKGKGQDCDRKRIRKKGTHENGSRGERKKGLQIQKKGKEIEWTGCGRTKLFVRLRWKGLDHMLTLWGEEGPKRKKGKRKRNTEEEQV